MNGILGVVLSGGRALRLGNTDKGLLDLAGRPLVAAVIQRFALQVDDLVLNANGDPARFRDLGLEVIADGIGPDAGPLAGVLAGLECARGVYDWVATVPNDAPFLPLDLVERLHHAAVADGADVACATDVHHVQPAFALWKTTIAEPLRQSLERDGSCGLARWMFAQAVVEVPFENAAFNPFTNINTPEDLNQARRLLEG